MTIAVQVNGKTRGTVDGAARGRRGGGPRGRDGGGRDREVHYRGTEEGDLRAEAAAQRGRLAGAGPRRHSRERSMRTGLTCSAVAMASVVCSAVAFSQQGIGDWPQHSRERPLPRVVTPGAPALPVPPPSDAIVLFDGTSLAKWEDGKGGPAQMEARRRRRHGGRARHRRHPDARGVRRRPAARRVDDARARRAARTRTAATAASS